LTTIDNREGTDPMAKIQYRNQAGAIVSVRNQGDSKYAHLPDNHYTAACSACLESRGTELNVSLDDARTWAAGHASKCSALPPFVTGNDVDRAGWTARAEEYAKRTARLLEGKSAIAGLGAGPLEAANPIESAQIYANLADVYARLAGL
jgi:hypothetical protein